MLNDSLFSHKTDDWETPKNIYNFYVIDRKWFDPCPFKSVFNGLEIDWETFNFVNPPYSQINKWVKKALEESKKGHFSVLLLPVRSDTKWFRDLFEDKSTSFTFIQGRLHFNNSVNSAPFPSMFVYVGFAFFSKVSYLSKESMLNTFGD